MNTVINIIKNIKFGSIRKIKCAGLYNDFLEITKFLDISYDVVSDKQRIYHIKNDMFDIVKCKCGKPARFIYSKGYSYCSKECRIKGQTKKQKETNQKIYGVDFASQLESTKVKVKKNNQKLYGVDSISQLKDTKRKAIKTNFLKYNKANFSKTKEFKNVIRNKELIKNSTKFGDNYELMNYNDEGLLFLHKKCDNKFIVNSNLAYHRLTCNVEICTHCNPINKNISGTELILRNFINSIYDGEILLNKRSIIPPYELDIYIPELELAFEFNGSLWHSELYKNKTYHYDKFIACEAMGINLIQIWDYDWVYKQNIIKSIISGSFNRHQKIYARKCILKKIKAKDCQDFINSSHIQGFVPATLYYGLFYNNELIQIMSFKRVKGNDWEISRLCSKLNTTVVGGASKLFKQFINKYNFDSLISYNNNDYFSGKIYEKLGMKVVSKNLSYKYINKQLNILSRQSCQKHKLIKQGYDPNKTEHEIMLERGYYRIYNSGNKKCVFVPSLSVISTGL